MLENYTIMYTVMFKSFLFSAPKKRAFECSEGIKRASFSTAASSISKRQRASKTALLKDKESEAYIRYLEVETERAEVEKRVLLLKEKLLLKKLNE